MAYSLDTTSKTDLTSVSSAESHQIREKVESTYHETVGSTTNVFLAMVRTYVAGVLIPTIAVNITCAFDQSPQARITMPADPRLFNLGKYDRVPVQVFVKETFVEAPKYILMFEGYIASRSYLSVANQREINLECVAFTEVFNDVKIRFMTSLEDTYSMMAPGNAHLSSPVYVQDFMFPMCLFYQGIGLKTELNPEGKKPITRPTDYLVNLIQYMEEAGTEVAPGGRFNDSIVSRYFATLAYNLHFDRRFCWLPYFDVEVDEAAEAAKNKSSGTSTTTSSSSSSTTSASTTTSTTTTTTASSSSSSSSDTSIGWAWETEGLEIDDPIRGGDTATMFPVLYGMKTSAAITAIASALQTCSKEFSINDLLKFLVNEMEYEFLVIANPAFHDKTKEEDKGLQLDTNRKKKLADSDLGGDVYAPRELDVSPTTGATEELVEKLQLKYHHERNCRRMVNFCLKPMFDDSYPPQCNVIFRTQVSSIQTHQIFSGTPTRVQVTNFNAFLGQIASNGAESSALAQYGTIDFYPSRHYGKDDEALGGPLSEEGRSVLSSELLDVERHTGPWVHRDRAPAWMTYAFNYTSMLAPETDDENQPREENSEEEYGQQLQIKKMREQYMRRQLIRAQMLSKQLNADCVFLPYITCGFPAVVYDSSDSGFSFAGNVISYEHNITENAMSTSVVLNGVRLLSEAVEAEANGMYPNPINSVHAVTHNKERLARVYNTILGTPDVTVSGAQPITWAEVKQKYSAAITDISTSPQTNIYEAYKIQRRNVITFEDYCTFMDLTRNPSGDDESGNIPTEIKNDWIEDRAKIVVFSPVPLKQAILPIDEKQLNKNETENVEKTKKELEEKNKELEAEVKELEEQAASKKASLEADVASAQAKLNATGGNTTANQKTLAAAQAALADFNSSGNGGIDAQINTLKSQITTNTSEISKLGSALNVLKGFVESVEKNQVFNSSGTSTDVRTLLKAIYTQETANNIY